jgi:hypothetical protein
LKLLTYQFIRDGGNAYLLFSKNVILPFFILFSFIEHYILCLIFGHFNVMTYTLAGKLGKDIYGEIMYEIEMFVQSELHGLAALQWAICQDSLSRYVCKALDISKIRMESTMLCSTST